MRTFSWERKDLFQSKHTKIKLLQNQQLVWNIGIYSQCCVWDCPKIFFNGENIRISGRGKNENPCLFQNEKSPGIHVQCTVVELLQGGETVPKQSSVQAGVQSVGSIMQVQVATSGGYCRVKASLLVSVVSVLARILSSSTDMLSQKTGMNFHPQILVVVYNAY